MKCWWNWLDWRLDYRRRRRKGEGGGKKNISRVALLRHENIFSWEFISRDNVKNQQAMNWENDLRFWKKVLFCIKTRFFGICTSKSIVIEHLSESVWTKKNKEWKSNFCENEEPNFWSNEQKQRTVGKRVQSNEKWS